MALANAYDPLVAKLAVTLILDPKFSFHFEHCSLCFLGLPFQLPKINGIYYGT